MMNERSTMHSDSQYECAWPLAVVPLTTQPVPISLDQVRQQGIPVLAFSAWPDDRPQIPPTPVPNMFSPEPEPDPLRRMSVKTTALVLGLALLLFLIGVAVLYREPIGDLIKARGDEAERLAIAAREQARYRALEDAVTLRLNDAGHAWTQLQSANALLSAKVESFIRQPIESAFHTPPAYLRRAIIGSPETLYAWTDLINTRLTPQEITSSQALFTTIESQIADRTLTEIDQRQLDRFLDWAAQRQKAIEAINIEPLKPQQSLDESGMVLTINAPERRSVQ